MKIRKIKCHPNRKYFANGLCKQCYYKEYVKKYYKRNKDKIKVANKQWQKDNVESHFKSMLYIGNQKKVKKLGLSIS